MRRQQADLRCAHEPPAGTVASATFESPLEHRGCLSAPKLGKLPLGVTAGFYPFHLCDRERGNLSIWVSGVISRY